MAKIFIDGSAGTTGLRIRERLEQRPDIALISLAEEERKDPAARRSAMAEADVAFFCLPDAAAVEAAALASEHTAIIDTSTAHRTAEGWTYGFPELSGQREKIRQSARIANPGCHASGFIALAAPLVKAGLLSPDAALSCFSVTGYSGGGKKMIAEYEGEGRHPALDSPRQYALGQRHKHLPEMAKLSGLETPPVFCPIVADYFSGMAVTIPLHRRDLRGSPEDAAEVYKSLYAGPVVRYVPCPEGMLAGNAMAGKDGMEITVAGDGERILLISVFDNLGKGASGAAIQNMNLLLGAEETLGLVL